MAGNPPMSPAAAAAAAAAVKAALKRAEQMLAVDQKTPLYLTTSVATIIFLFTVAHWSRYVHNRKSRKSSAFSKIPTSVSRAFRSILLKPVPGFKSAGDALLVFTYLIINIVLTVVNIQWAYLVHAGKRAGWLALTNLLVVVFLSLKNTPLALLTAASYERLQPLHQAAGYITLAFVTAHAILMSYYFSHIIPSFAYTLLEAQQRMAMAAAVALLITVVAATFLRKKRYEAFYVIHVLMFLIIIPMVALHQRSWETGTLHVTVICGAIWALDRLMRCFKVVRNSMNNGAIITPLPLGGTRITLRRSPSGAVSGRHCFVWLPKIRAFETHPFTIVAATPTSMELVIDAHDGFTNDLHQYALKNPGASLRASIDGPYGALPAFAQIADHVILIAGGTGASFTFGVALDMIRKLGNSTSTTIDFIWSVKNEEKISWYAQELDELRASPLVAITLHTTQSQPTTSDASTKPGVPKIEQLELELSTGTTTGPQDSFITDPEKQEKQGVTSSRGSELSGSNSSLRYVPGRPNVTALIRGVVSSVAPGNRVAIAACGPGPMMKSVRSTAAACIKVDGPSVTLHLEQFGW